MITAVTPLGLLVLLAFFFFVALAFTVWAALTVGDAAKRAQLRQEQLPAGGGRRAADTGRAAKAGKRASKRSAAEPPREPKPWERKPAPEPVSAVRQEQNGRAVVKPRQPNTDAFERFLESEKRSE